MSLTEIRLQAAPGDNSCEKAGPQLSDKKKEEKVHFPHPRQVVGNANKSCEAGTDIVLPKTPNQNHTLALLLSPTPRLWF